ncbi:uncharacterized protein CC84DRAFT_482603 [Paraphaeosphaeria sporulosa]|uniref:Uncharacterized protein n=1 Tax=Paraphaeosphaeria sporulosa TaxID=1460663 RepID=A0A177CTX5_9PLEO|nr:uncharacterized protein CC84DRAFT_482603 [Paraphaeosphaeria sporulosa]OAG10372.1 hypothetical protein CC84DRAFT_482603 [Paraphaeosphaeria sporulosa]
MANFGRMSKHCFSLGSLYKFPTRLFEFRFLGCRRSASTLREGTTGSTTPSVVEPPGHGVNLGSLYKSYEPVAGWGCFEDGSVYVNVKPWGSDMDHASFEAKMRLLEPLVRKPPPRIYQIRSEHPNLSRLIFVDCQPSIKLSKSEESCTIFVRNANDGEKLSEERHPFRRCHLTYDQLNFTQSSSKVDRPPIVLPHPVRMSMNRALENFRGTLVGGVLKPNVRLGNGLTLRKNHSLDKQRVLRGIQYFLKMENAREAQTKTPTPSSNTRHSVGFNALAGIVQGNLGSSLPEKALSRSRVDGKHSESESQSLTKRENKVSKRETAVNTREVAVSRREVAVNAREAMLNKREAAVYSKEASLYHREASLLQKVAALNKKEAKLNERRDTLDKRTVEFGIERRRHLAKNQKPEVDYDDIFPELANSDSSERRTRITLPQGPVQ